ncbi:MAG: THUMP domain-containing protein [Bacteroidaceae bacterium]
MEEFELIAKTFQGLEEVLAKELTELNANNIQIGRRMVAFTGNKEMMYKANFALRTATRILKPIKHFKARTADDVYNAIREIDWSQYLDLKTTFAVDSVVYSEEFRHSKFVAYKVKDAIVDYFRETTGERPNIRISNPDIKLNIHIADDKCTLSLDSSGESLHHRGYRQATVDAPINEVLAAGMILLSGWNGECDFIDPMCGSGTIAIEAALIARNMAPGLFRKQFAFEKWKDFDREMYENIYNDDSNEREFEHHIYGYDIAQAAIAIATENVKAAGVTQTISLAVQPFQQFIQPTEKSIIIMNPPYGERIAAPDILGLYRMIGTQFKHQFIGGEAWVLSYREECFTQIGLKPSLKIPLFNGSLDCQYHKYQIFDGKFNDFRANDGEIKTDDERRQMAEKRRFKQHRDFKESIVDTVSDESDGIPSYVLKKHRDFVESRERIRRPRHSEPGERKAFGERKPFSSGERKPFGERNSFGSGERKSFSGKTGERRASDRDHKPRSFGRDGKPFTKEKGDE